MSDLKAAFLSGTLLALGLAFFARSMALNWRADRKGHIVTLAVLLTLQVVGWVVIFLYGV